VLERMAAALRELPSDVRVAYGQIMLLTEDGQSLYPVGKPWLEVKERFRQVMSIPHPGAMHRRSLFEVHGGFDESFRIAGDYELLLRELKSADAAFVPGLISTGMRQGGVSSNLKNLIKALLESRRAQCMHGQRFPGRVWLGAVARVYVRRMVLAVLGERMAEKIFDVRRRMLRKRTIWTNT
jgi:hypothetical protein